MFDDARDRLYAAPPEQFMTLRAELARAARAAGDPATAKAVTALRKPTLAAALINQLALADRAVIDRVLDLHRRLSTAHQGLDATELRVLTARRRLLVGELTDATFRSGGAQRWTPAQRDEVSATFDAAVADPDVANRLGRLTRAERFSGFGPIPTGSPELTLLQGGKPERRTDRSDGPSTQAVPAAVRRQLSRARDEARKAFDTAAQRLGTAEESEQAAARRVTSLTADLADLHSQLHTAKDALDSARGELRAARTHRRTARSVLDRAERKADR